MIKGHLLCKGLKMVFLQLKDFEFIYADQILSDTFIPKDPALLWYVLETYYSPVNLNSGQT